MEGEFKELSRLVARMLAERWVAAARDKAAKQNSGLRAATAKRKKRTSNRSASAQPE